MDHINDEQSTFEAVWERVTESSCCDSPAAQNKEGEADILAGLIISEAENKAFYSAAARNARTDCAALFKNLASVSAKRLGRLQTLYFLMNGNNCSFSPPETHRVQSSLSALRSAYWRESDTASRLISAAGSIGNGKFNSCAGDFARQAAENAERIMQFIDNIMK
ncbi:MAG: hypothetical protein PUB32_08345 [Clostridiales bacterium]|nr:hypothetical protein [Clostridiales bacterium]